MDPSSRPAKPRRRAGLWWLLLPTALSIALLAASAGVREACRGVLLGYRSDLSWIADQDVRRVQVSSSPRLVADYYAAPPTRQPLVVFAHGSVPGGRRDGASRLFSRRLQEEGFPVLAVDLPGFGESEAPDAPLPVEFSFSGALVSAAEYALKNNLAGPEGFVYVGSSLGAMVALQAGRLDPLPRGLVAQGAADTEARFLRGGESWKRRFARERLSAMRLRPDAESLQVMGDCLLELDVTRQLRAGPLPPVLLIYGERDASLPTVRSFLSGREGTFRLHVVPDVPHSLHLKPLWGGFVLHNRAAMDSVIESILGWIPETRASPDFSPASPPPAPARSARGDGASRRSR